ncbi:MAG: hypothetical protein JWQ71_2195 [Pedosphaera sp.]|nr:hypothetical protein [Pedosphaera sp.]
MTNSFANLSLEQLKRAVQIREQIESMTHELNQILGSSPLIYTNTRSTNGNGHGNAKRNLSPSARARIAAAQRLRWAKYNAAKGPQAISTQKNRLSAAGRAKVAAAVKARWAKFRAAKARLVQTN